MSFGYDRRENWFHLLTYMNITVQLCLQIVQEITGFIINFINIHDTRLSVRILRIIFIHMSNFL